MKADTLTDLPITIVHSSDPSLRVPAITYMTDCQTCLLIGCVVVIPQGRNPFKKTADGEPASGESSDHASLS